MDDVTDDVSDYVIYCSSYCSIVRYCSRGMRGVYYVTDDVTDVADFEVTDVTNDVTVWACLDEAFSLTCAKFLLIHFRCVYE